VHKPDLEEPLSTPPRHGFDFIKLRDELERSERAIAAARAAAAMAAVEQQQADNTDAHSQVSSDGAASSRAAPLHVDGTLSAEAWADVLRVAGRLHAEPSRARLLVERIPEALCAAVCGSARPADGTVVRVLVCDRDRNVLTDAALDARVRCASPPIVVGGGANGGIGGSGAGAGTVAGAGTGAAAAAAAAAAAGTGPVLPMARGLAGFVATTGNTVRLPDASHDERFRQEAPLGAIAGGELDVTEVGPAMCLAVVAKDAVLAVVELMRPRGGMPFTESNAEAAEAVAHHAGLALANCDRALAERESARSRDLIIEMAKMVTRNVGDLPRLASSMSAAVKRLVSAERCSLFLVDENTDELYSVYFDNGDEAAHQLDADVPEEVRFSASKGIAGYVARTGLTVNIPDAYADPRFNPEIDVVTGFRTRQILCMPIFAPPPVAGMPATTVTGGSPVSGLGGAASSSSSSAPRHHSSEQRVIAVAQMLNKPPPASPFSRPDEQLFSALASFLSLGLATTALHRATARSLARHKVAAEVLAYHAVTRVPPAALTAAADPQLLRAFADIALPRGFEEFDFNTYAFVAPIPDAQPGLFGGALSWPGWAEAFAVLSDGTVGSGGGANNSLSASASTASTASTATAHSPKSGAPSEDIGSIVAVMWMFDRLGLLAPALGLDRAKLARFVATVRKNYRDVPYHNWGHALSVAHGMFIIVLRARAAAGLAPDGAQRPGGAGKSDCDPGVLALSRKVFGDQVQVLALMVATLCHDLDHRGTTNMHQVVLGKPLAELYPEATMERHHIAQFAAILATEGHNFMERLDEGVYARVMREVRELVLGTDMSGHRANVDAVAALRGAAPETWTAGEAGQRATRRFMSVAMNTADLVASVKPWRVARAIAFGVLEEFWRQGDIEREQGHTPAPLHDRAACSIPEAQLGFLDFVALPTFRAIAGVLPATGVFASAAQNIRDTWAKIKAAGGDGLEDTVEDIDDEGPEPRQRTEAAMAPEQQKQQQAEQQQPKAQPQQQQQQQQQQKKKKKKGKR
jgi:GAF domain-containing protein